MSMNESNNGADSVAAYRVPLFASSWVALYCLLRSSLLGEPKADQAESADADHRDQAQH
jgi:hypothetical protein